jgi:hypothetical protein
MVIENYVYLGHNPSHDMFPEFQIRRILGVMSAGAYVNYKSGQNTAKVSITLSKRDFERQLASQM